MRTYRYTRYANPMLSYFFAAATSAAVAGMTPKPPSSGTNPSGTPGASNQGAQKKGPINPKTQKPDGSMKQWKELDVEMQQKLVQAAAKFKSPNEFPQDWNDNKWTPWIRQELKKATDSGAINPQQEQQEAKKSGFWDNLKNIAGKAGEKLGNMAGKTAAGVANMAKGIRDKARGYDDSILKIAGTENLKDVGLAPGQNNAPQSSGNNNMMDWMNNPMMQMMMMMGGGGGGMNPFMMMNMMNMMQNMQSGNQQQQDTGPQRMSSADAKAMSKGAMKSIGATARNLQVVKKNLQKVMKKYGRDQAAEQATAMGYDLDQFGL